MNVRMLITTAVIACVLSLEVPTAAAQANASPPTVKAVYPANQKPGVKGYFDVSAKPNQTQVLQVQMTNPNPRSLTVRIRSADAYTSPQGGIMYDIHADSKDSAITDDLYRLSSHIQVPSTVTLAPGAVKMVPITVNVPNLDTGTILGGVQFVTEGNTNTTTQQTEKGKANFIIKTENVFSMAIELDLPKSSAPNFTFGDAGYESDSGQGYIMMRNDAPMIQPDITGTYQVLDSSGTKMFAGKINPMKMAPKTQIHYLLPWNQSTLAAGAYTLTIAGSVAGKPINVSRNFTIAASQVTEYQNTHPVNVVQQKGTPVWVWGLVALGAIAIGVLMFRMGRRQGGA